ncbi:hypothetical protein Nham_2015 [Nitrobacter hamburgensis X14]|uniref:Uncharacterized protein n=1 Tax=Nitrobacter hamburgensis (strain DSM 10229 / NCIMB 13809 / X14) TaxID=323097 RepID=Q1QLT4_NITHX|nr:hypothetical protein [Nitrobacter hamburgensis]ABE62813.1 hypothetical protein Nham_2015 [Nitrobacter hamburgensis X14]
MAKAKSTTPKPIRRQVVEAQIDLLIDMLNTMDGDNDLEPSLGFSNGGFRPEDQPQEGFGFAMNANAGDDCEDEHDGAEPTEDGEASLGWTSTFNQASASWQANHLGTIDLEEGVGAVRKNRPVSRTGGRVLVGVEVF